MHTMASVITKRNKNLLKENNHSQARTCNCENKPKCTMNGYYLKKCFVYNVSSL